MINVSWDAPELQVDSDTKWRAQYRALQSWYRENHLKVPPGVGGNNRLVGSMIDASAAEAQPHLNFLLPEIAAYVDSRVPEVKAADGTIEVDRLRRNLLSSMPLAFNLFGFLRTVPEVTARVFSTLLSLQINEITKLEVEWAPRSSDHLGDRTAFDAFIEYRRKDGARAFLGVETKYTEPFSTTVYDRPTYRALVEGAAGIFRPGAYERLLAPETNQLMRNVLLAMSLKKKDAYAEGHVLVVACEGDPGAAKALAGLKEQMRNPETVLLHATVEKVVSAFTHEPKAEAWAHAFERRYLDLAPIRAR